MKTILENELQEIKDLEQRIKDEKEFVRSSLIAAIKEVYHPDVKKIGSILQVIQYKDLDNWDVSNVRSMYHMFVLSKFNQDISMWKINPNCKITMIFTDSKIKDSYKPKCLKK